MRRGVVMEVHRNKAVILTQNGSFETVRIPRNQNPQIGEEITVNPVVVPFPGKVVLPSLSLISAAMIFFLLISTVLPFHTNRAAAAYVSFDINPSIEVAIDDELSALRVTPLNEDAEKLLSEPEKYIDMDFSKFSRTLFTMLEGEGFFKDNGKIVIATSFPEEDLKQGFNSMLTESVTQLKNSPNIVNHNIACTFIESSFKVRNKAKDQGLSIGKYVTYQEAVKNGNNITVQDAKRLPITKLLEKKALAENDQEEQLNKPNEKDQKDQEQTKKDSKKVLTVPKQTDTQKGDSKTTEDEKDSAVVEKTDEPQNEGQNDGNNKQIVITSPPKELGKETKNASQKQDNGNHEEENKDTENKKDELTDSEDRDKKKHRGSDEDKSEENSREKEVDEQSKDDEEEYNRESRDGRDRNERDDRDDRDMDWDHYLNERTDDKDDNQHSLEINIEHNGNESTIYINGEKIDEDLRELLEHLLDFRK